MGWGTDFKADIYISRETFDSVQSLKNKIEDVKDDIKDTMLLLHIYTQREPPHDAVHERKAEVNEICEYLIETHILLYKLELYLGFLEENNAEPKDFNIN
jgi:hypothetical protein